MLDGSSMDEKVRRAAGALMAWAALVPSQAGATVFTSQPSDFTVTPGLAARFDTATDQEQSSLWQVSSDSGKTWTDLPGPHYTYLVLPSVTLADNGKQFRRRASDPPNAAALSRAATLTVQSSTSRRLALLAGGLGGHGAPVDQIIGSNLRFGTPEWISADSAGNVYLGQYSTVLKLDAARRAQTLAGNRDRFGSNDGKGSAALFTYIGGSVRAPNGDLFLADMNTHTIRKIAPDGMVSTFAGSGDAGSADGTGRAASFNRPTGMARDSAGNLFVADTGNHTIRRITPAGVVSTWAGKAGVAGSGGTPRSAALFNGPQGLAIGPDQTLFISDTGNHAIRRILPTGQASKVAGLYGVRGSADGAGSTARFNTPLGIAVGSNGDIFVADSVNNTVRKIVGTTVTTIAGTPGRTGSVDGDSVNARFNTPVGLALDPSGNVLVADSMNHTIRRLSPTGVVTTWAGRAAQSGFANGTGADARFASPWGLTTDSHGNVYVADWGNSAVRKVTSAGVVSSYTVGLGGTFRTPKGVVLDAAGNMIVTDSGSCVIRRITPMNVATVIAGEPGDCRYVNGNGRNARFIAPSGITQDAQGNLFVTDATLIRKITPSLEVSRHAGAFPSDSARDGTLATARFSDPSGLAFDNAGNLFVADVGSIRKITPAGTVNTLAGALNDSSGLIDGPGSQARFAYLSGLTIDPSGNLYTADYGSHTVRRISPAGVVTTVLGTRDMATVVLGSNPLVSHPFGVAMIDASHLAISSENSILVLTLP
jgi:streptogramin lyase